MSEDDKGFMLAVRSFISLKQDLILREASKKYKTPMSRLIALTLDKECIKDEPFRGLKIELPCDEYIEYSYAEEAQRIVNFMSKLKKPIGLDVLYLIRHEAEIEDGEVFLNAFRELVENKIVESCELKGKTKKYNHPDYRVWQLKTVKMTKKQEDRKTKEYKKYLKLKEKYDAE